uniref:Major facilitator superfamily (MFS) profile domain-containing protein n=1 Tax=Acyrthosiphon pisum TaxID=7029 RepID=A0A8R2BAP1_ACYPI
RHFLFCSAVFPNAFLPGEVMEKELYISTNTASGPNSVTRTEPFVKIIALVATLGGLLFGYDTGVVSGALLFMRSDLQLTPFTTGLVTSSLLFGAAFGALLAGHFADAMGRRKIIITLAFIFALGAVGSAFAPDVVSMIMSRLFLGIAVGGAAATVPVYIAEIAPANKRGQLVTLQELMIVSGQLLAYVSNATFNEIWGGEHTWRWMLALSTVPAVLLWLGMIFMPESPRWLVMRGNVREARHVLEKTRAAEDVEWELEEIEETIEENRQKASSHLKDPQIVLLETAKGVRIDVEIFVNCAYGYDIQCEVVGETGIASLPEPMSVQTRSAAKLSTGILTDWKKRFIDAYDVELQDFINNVLSDNMTGPSAWDGYAAAVAADACVAAQNNGEIVPITMPPRPAFYQ